MAIRYAVANGNWSNTATWFGGVIPTHGDMAYANNFTVTIDQNIDIGNEVLTNAGSFVVGQLYVITDLGNTNFTTVGAASNTVGLPFVATAVGTGTGTATTRSGLTNASLASPAITAGGSFALNSNFNIRASIMGGAAANTLAQTNNASSTITGLIGFSRSTGNALHISTPGTFVINGDIYGGSSSSGAAINMPSGIGPNVTINGNIYGPIASGGRPIMLNGSGGTYAINGNFIGNSTVTNSTGLLISGSNNTVTVTGNVTGGTQFSGEGILIQGPNNSITITGDVYSASSGFGPGVMCQNTGTLTLNGNVYANGVSGLYITVGSPTVIINGNVGSPTANNSTAVAISISTSATVNVTGTVYGGNTNSAYGISLSNAACVCTVGQLIPRSAAAINFDGSGGNLIVNSDIPSNTNTSIITNTTNPVNVSITVNGNVTGCSVPSTPAINFGQTVSNGFGTITVNGNVIGGSAALSPGIAGPGGASGSGFGNIIVNGNVTASSVSNGIRCTTTSASNAVILNGNAIDSSAGFKAIAAARWYFGGSPASREITVSNNALSTYTFYGDSIWAADAPAESDVRLGVIYGAGDIYEGTLNVPPVGAVSFGVPVDNTTGTLTGSTGAFSAEDVRAAIGLASANLDTQLAGIPTAVRSELTTELGRIDAAISTRLASADYDTPPTAAVIADEVRLELATELARIDAPISEAGGGATSGEIATAVRNELAVELARVDAAITTRLAAADYDAPIAAATIATAVRNELTTELSRIDAAITTRLATAGYTAPETKEAIAVAVEAALLNEGDGQQLIDAILQVINTNLNLPALELTAIAQAVRTELATELARVDAAISSRLATAGYTTPPTAATVAGEVRSELAVELAHLDADVSSRLATAGYTTPPTASAVADEVRLELTTELARIDIPVSEATTDISGIPTAVRSELTTELARIDAAVSTRLASADYDTPPTASAVADEVRLELATELARIDANVSTAGDPGTIAEAVRTELSPELDRVANCSTVDTTGAQLAALL